MYPTGAASAFMCLSMAPGNPETLKAKIADLGRKPEDPQIPVCAVKLMGGRGTNLEIPMMPTPASQGLSSLTGWGMVPLLLMSSDTAGRPSSEELRREMFTFLRGSRGQNNLGNIANYYDGTDTEEPWPEKEKVILSPDNLWPAWKALRGRESNSPAGKKNPQKVEGGKYNPTPKGGFEPSLFSPALKGKYKSLLARTANGALATSTWKSYSTVWKQLPEIARETGVSIALPMSLAMIEAIVAYQLAKGLKPSTIQGYLTSIRNGHLVRGLECPALDHPLISSLMKGSRNLESQKKKEPHAVVTLAILTKLWTRINSSTMALDEKRLLWAIYTLLFLGSLRPAEALSQRKGEYDEVRTLTWADIKLLETTIDRKEVRFLQLRLKQPKTSRSMPTQIVEIPEIGGQFCAVKAFRKWKQGRKARQDQSTPVFTKTNGELVTISYVNRTLKLLLKEEIPIVTARAFRPGLATILARNGANSEELKSLGRWSSRAYEAYIRKGRANNWRGARAQILQAVRAH